MLASYHFERRKYEERKKRLTHQFLSYLHKTNSTVLSHFLELSARVLIIWRGLSKEGRMLRRRTSTASGGGAGSAFKPFVLPLKNKVTNTLDEEEEDLSVHACAKENRQALRSGASLTVKRLPFLSFLSVPQIKEKNEQRLKQPFKSPCLSGRTTESDRLLQRKTLGVVYFFMFEFLNFEFISNFMLT
jgi:hypothetical protein